MAYYTLKNSQFVAAFKSMGAELCSFHDNSGTEYIWQADEQHWGRHAPLLFPFVGKLKDDQFTYGGKTYQQTQHGFARDLHFTATEKTDNAIKFVLTHNEDTLAAYPFRFTLEITYTLNQNQLAINHRVVNEDEKIMYFSIGGHPAINCPIIPGTNFHDYFIEFQRTETLARHFIKDGLQTGESKEIVTERKSLNLSYGYFEQDAIIFKELRSEQVSLSHPILGKVITMNLTEFPYLGIWTKPNAPFICLEPWLGLADRQNSTGDLIAKEGIQQLEAGKDFNAAYSLTFHPVQH